MLKITAVLITKNEEKRIRTALASVQGFVDEIIVVDDFSGDATCAIAEKEFGARVFRRLSQGDLSAQRNFGADQALGPWILFMDTDEVFSPKIFQALREAVDVSNGAVAFLARRLNHLMGHPVFNAGAHEFYMLRLYHKDKVRFREPGVHHEWDVDGKTVRVEIDVPHYPFDTASQMIERALCYGDYESELFLKDKNAVSVREVRYQLTWRALKSFWKMYVKKKGFRDGVHGLVWCLCMVIGSQIRWIKIWEKAQSKGCLTA